METGEDTLQHASECEFKIDLIVWKRFMPFLRQSRRFVSLK